MKEIERLQNIVDQQGQELQRLRQMLGICRVAMSQYKLEGQTMNVVVTCIGVDEQTFLQNSKAELRAIADLMLARLGASKVEELDPDTGEPLPSEDAHPKG